MPFSIRYRQDLWCVVSDGERRVVSEHPTRLGALQDLAVRYSADPVLAELDWGEQRVIAYAAYRWMTRHSRAGSEVAIIAAARLMDPAPLTEMDVAWLDSITRAELAHRHLSRDLAGRQWPRTASSARRRAVKMSGALATLDHRLGDRLYTLAVAALRDALRRAGVKATIRAKNRGKKPPKVGALTGTVLAAISVTADELLDRAFQSFQVDATAAMKAADRQRARIVAASFDDVDPDEIDDEESTDRRAEGAAALLAALLLGRARGVLADAVLAEGDLRLAVPFADVRTAMRVRDGWQVVQTINQGPNRTPEADGVTLLPPEHGSSAIDELLGKANPGSTYVRGYEWVHGYFGDPVKPFEGHLMVDGETYTDETRSEVLAADPGEWPFVSVYSVDDHPDCTCFEVITYEPDEGG